MGGDAGSVPFVLSMLAVTLGGIFIVGHAHRRHHHRHRGQARRSCARADRSSSRTITPSSSAGRPRSSTSSARSCWRTPTSATSASSSSPTRTRSRWRPRSAQRHARTRGRLASSAAGQPDRPGRPGAGQPPDVALDHRPVARGRRPRHRRHQDPAGDHQRPEPQARAVPDRRRDPRRAEHRGGAPGQSRARRSSCSAASSSAASRRRPAGSPACRSSTWSCSTSAATRSTSIQDAALAGRQFGDALRHVPDVEPDRHRARPSGQPQLNPPMDTRHRQRRPADLHRRGRRHDQARGRAGRRGTRRRDRRRRALRRPGIERTLVLGWNSRTPGLLIELDSYVSDGSRLLVIADGPGVGRPGRGRRPPSLAAQADVSARRHDRPRRARRSDGRGLRARRGDVLLRHAGRAARRRPDPGDAAAPARHRGQARRELHDRQRDARRSQPRPGAGHARRRLHRQRQARVS